MSKRGRDSDADKVLKIRRDYPGAQEEWLADMAAANPPMALGALPAPPPDGDITDDEIDEDGEVDPFYDMSIPVVLPAHVDEVPAVAVDDETDEDEDELSPVILPRQSVGYLSAAGDDPFKHILSFLDMREAAQVAPVSKRFAAADRTRPIRDTADHEDYNEATRGRRTRALRNDPKTILDLSVPYSDTGFRSDYPFTTPFKDISELDGPIDSEAVMHLLELGDLAWSEYYTAAVVKLYDTGNDDAIDYLAQIEILDAATRTVSTIQALRYVKTLPEVLRLPPVGHEGYEPADGLGAAEHEHLLGAMAQTPRIDLATEVFSLSISGLERLAHFAYSSYLERGVSNPALLAMIQEKSFVPKIQIHAGNMQFNPEALGIVRELKAVGVSFDKDSVLEAYIDYDQSLLDGPYQEEAKRLAEFLLEVLGPVSLDTISYLASETDIRVAFELALHLPSNDYARMADIVEESSRPLSLRLRAKAGLPAPPDSLFDDSSDDDDPDRE